MSFQAVKAAWLKRVDAQLLQILENFQSILTNCQIDSEDPTQFYKEAFQLSLHADNIVNLARNSAVDNLLSLTSEIRWAHLVENKQ